MPFEGYCRLEFIDPRGERHKPGDPVSLDTETPEQQRDVERLTSMGVIQLTDPAGNVEPDGDPELLNHLIAENAAAQRSTAPPKPRKPSGRAAAKIAEKEARER